MMLEENAAPIAMPSAKLWIPSPIRIMMAIGGIPVIELQMYYLTVFIMLHYPLKIKFIIFICYLFVTSTVTSFMSLT